MRIPMLELKQKVLMANFPHRPRDSHKGMFGSVLVIGGASGMIGAPLLAARAALKLGAGYVHVGLLADNAPSVDLQQPELMIHSAAESLGLRNTDVVALGCGMGQKREAQQILYHALAKPTTLVLDADALTLLAHSTELQADQRNRKSSSIMTPHPGEAAQLLGCSSKEIQKDRPAAAQKLAQQFNASVVLKGADSLCVTADGTLYINTTGNPGMSGPGMGDVLTGMIAAFIAQGMSADHAMLLAVHLHGAAGDALAKQHACIGMTASEVIEWARWLLNQWL